MGARIINFRWRNEHNGCKTKSCSPNNATKHRSKDRTKDNAPNYYSTPLYRAKDPTPLRTGSDSWKTAAYGRSGIR